VIKLGGASLFHPSGFQSELNDILQEFQRCKVYLMVGGGELIEAIRSLHRMYPILDPVSLHWRCIQLLDHTCQIAAELTPHIPMIRSNPELVQFRGEPNTGSAWVSPQSFYQRDRTDNIQDSWRPREGWETTSDALAWLLAMTTSASRLVILKRGISSYPTLTLEHAATLGIVDPEIARLFRLHKNHSLTLEFKEFGSRKNC
jgi:aspartokinase-like uncharacterized kinase